MEDIKRPYTEEEFDGIFKASGIDEIAKDFCKKELEDWMDNVKEHGLKEFKTYREAAWNNLIRYSYPEIYAEQRKHGQSHKWSQAFTEAFSTYDDGREDKLYMCLMEAYDTIEDPEREKELTIFFNHFSEDPVYNGICQRYFKEVESDVWLDLAREYAEEYHKCIAEGKSATYADAYADRATSRYPENDRIVYATAYEAALNHGYEPWKASSFADYFVEVNKYGCPRGSYSKSIINLDEEWQNNLYDQLIK